MHDVDTVLLPFLYSKDESERDRILGELLLEHATPIIRITLKQRLNFNVSRLGTNPDNPDAEDLYSKVITEIVERLRELQAEPEKKGIKHFDQYVQRVAVNVCHNYLRSKAPQRYHLKSNLRYLLDSHKGFIIWRDVNNVVLRQNAIQPVFSITSSSCSPLVSMMQSTNFGDLDHHSNLRRLHCPSLRGILSER